ncbi:type IX secretion system membrane protein PorP/SprF [Pontibacter qinzhouensis]|uniref:Type IX secretion system membrane protein PorP/SprF n=1 Tax=Pontibacter qinzhouensis TaxID=2603253 RepID=A0A5C8KCP5_9BACT|nr:PorP/SprF family type IX secretion system membrane protein [Pontibacter qinzhouensis]TXK51346.1 type IX secretion system membrane protein PorP/SprF [Pontibacter qinzhouensis]
MSGKKVFLCCLVLWWSLTAAAQEVIFSQPYASRQYLNPAFTGLGHAWSASVVHRRQWPALNGSFITNQASADYRLPGTKSAFGMFVQQDRAGVGGLQKLQASAAYGYHTPLTGKWAFSAGLQASIASLRLNYDNLVFGDQLSDNGMVAVTSAEVSNFEPASYLSFATGGMLYTDQFWFGFTAANLNRPAYGFGQKTTLPLRFAATAGYKFYARSYQEQGRLFELSFIPTAAFIRDQNFSRANLGIYTIYTPLTLGLIYQGVPVITTTAQDQTLAMLVGLQLEQCNIGFSHAVGLKGFSTQAGGATEVTLRFTQVDFSKLLKNNNKNKLNRNNPWPAF